MHAQHSGVLPRQDTCMRGELDAPAEPMLPGAKDRIQVSAHTTAHCMLCHDSVFRNKRGWDALSWISHHNDFKQSIWLRIKPEGVL